METPWRFQMFGGLRAERGDQVVNRFQTQKTGALLAYLAYHCDRSHPREVLIEIFWPGSSPVSGRRKLSLALTALRHQFEPAGVPTGAVIRADRLTVQLNADAVETDVAQFWAAVKAAAESMDETQRARHLMAAVDLYRGELLSGYYEDWVLAEQRRLADIHYQAVRRLAVHFEEDGQWEQAVDFARRAVDVDPLREDAHRDLMRLLACAGQPSAALRQFEDLKRIFREELDVEPSAATVELAREIRERIESGLPADLAARPSVVTLLVAEFESAASADIPIAAQNPSQAGGFPNAMLQGLLAEFPDARPIEMTENRFTLGFGRPSDSVRFALLHQLRLRAVDSGIDGDVRPNVGIHFGEVGPGDESESGTEPDPLDMPLTIASRVVSLASGGQILMTRGVFDNARQVFNGRLLPGVGKLRWLSHGPYVLQGFEEPCAICEVGEVGVAPLRPPADCEAGRSVAVPERELVLGWRPAVEQAVPNTEWVLEKKLGEGGFGEVWRARHTQTKNSRVFKFCFRADRLRALKREMTLFRLLRETLGDRPDIARLHDVQFEEAPYYLELEDTPGGNLAEWLQRQGGCAEVPLETRLEIVAQIANALAAAHSVGVIHKDVKPSNVLVEENEDGSKQIRLTDFGIGEVKDRDALLQADFTVTGFTETISSRSEMASHSGTRLYMAPELLSGRPASIQSDVYSLGVLFYQLIVGDLTKPITTDWERNVRNPLLREDISRCLAGEPSARFGSANDVANRIRALPHRRRLRRMKRVTQAVAAIFLVAGVLITAGFVLRSRELRRENALRKETEQQLYYSNIALAANYIDQLRYEHAADLLTSCPERLRNWEWGHLQHLCNLDIMTLRGHDALVTSVGFSPDGKWILTASEDKTARIWEAKTGIEILALEGHTSVVQTASFSPDGRRVVTASWDSTAKIWDAETGRELLTLVGHESDVNCAAFCPQGKRIVTGSDDRTARVWNTETGEQICVLSGHSDLIWTAVFSPDGRYIATGSGAEDKTARLWDAETGRELFVLKGHQGRIPSLVFSPDGKRLFTGCMDGWARIWDVESGLELRAIYASGWGIHGVAVSPDGLRLATVGHDRVIRIWDIETGSELLSLRGHRGSVKSVAFSPDGQLLVTGSWDYTARIWDAHVDHSVRVFQGHEAGVRGIVVSPNGRLLATMSNGDQTARIWDAATGRELLCLKTNLLGIGSVAFTRDGRGLAVGGWLGTVIVDSGTGREMLRLGLLSKRTMSVAVSPDNSRIATGHEPGDIRTWDARSGEQLRVLRGHSHNVWELAFSADGRHLVSACHDGTARIWDVETGKELAVLEEPDRTVHSADFSPDGRRVVTGGYRGTPRIWDLDTVKEVVAFTGHTADVQHVAFSPDGRRVVSVGSTEDSKVWDAQTGRELLTLKAGGGNKRGAWCAEFSSDGRRIATANIDNTATVFETLPWHEEDLPGDATMPYEQRLHLWKQARWTARRKEATAEAEETTPRVVLVKMSPFVAPLDEQGRRMMSVCAANLLEIHAALVQYRSEHDGQMPNGLSDLVPDYVSSKTLVCPLDPKGIAVPLVARIRDANLPRIYDYQFGPVIAPGRTETYREWKTRQLKEFGSVVPSVRCRSPHAERLRLNLSYGATSLQVRPIGRTASGYRLKLTCPAICTRPPRRRQPNSRGWRDSRDSCCFDKTRIRIRNTKAARMRTSFFVTQKVGSFETTTPAVANRSRRAIGTPIGISRGQAIIRRS